MPANTFTLAFGCDPTTGGFLEITATAVPAGAYTDYAIAGDVGYAAAGSFVAADLPLRFPGLANDRYVVRVNYETSQGQAGTGTRTATLSCGGAPGALVLDTFSHTDETAANAQNGTGTIQASGGVAPLTAAIVALGLTQPATAGVPNTFTGLAVGSHELRVTDAAAAVVLATIDVAAYAPAVTGCLNPDADNYDPLASTGDEAYCTFSPKVVWGGLPDLVALGRPVWATLASAGVAWSTPSAATGTLHVASAPATGAAVVVNGYRFTAGPITAPDRFFDADTLAEALRGVPALASQYVIEATPTDVLLTARAIGPAGNLALASTTAAVTVASTEGQPATHSQRRAAWGCWLEVWALPGLAFGGTAKTGAVLAERFESRYREDNAYAFDIAEGLRAFTGLSFDCSDRVVGYFLRYGETYANTAGGYRRTRSAAGETAVRFGLEAVEIMPADDDGVRTLTARPGAWTLPDGNHVYVAQLADGSPGVVLVEYADATEPSQRADAPAVYFANGQGGRDTQYFEGIREELTKRTASLYSTPTGRAAQKAEIPPAFRLQSGQLLRDEWDWLRLELGSTAAAWLEDDEGFAPILITALTADADELTGLYSVAIECEYCDQPARGLTN